jgi:hypothetical protein
MLKIQINTGPFASKGSDATQGLESGRWPPGCWRAQTADHPYWLPLLSEKFKLGRSRFPHLPSGNNNTDLGLILHHHTCKFYKVPARVQKSCFKSLKMNTPDNPLDCSRWVDSPKRTVAESLS